MKISAARYWFTSMLLMGLVGCQYDNSSAVTATSVSSSVTPSTDDQPQPLSPCGSGAPRVDRDKIQQKLLADGVITPQMSDTEAQQKVSEYIKQRQQAYKKCLKRNPS